jgi:uncharacterized protein (DUF1697 family)
MPRYVAFLRAINVGGHVVKMDKLRELFASLGFSRVETFIASGNVIFETGSKATASLEGKIESCLCKALGYEVATFVRTDAEVAATAQYKPFRDADLKSAGAFCVGFLAEPLGRESERMLMEFKTAIDDFHTHGREIYWLCQTRQGESTFSNVSMEKRLGIRATFRGINTIVRLAAKYPPSNSTFAGTRRQAARR